MTIKIEPGAAMWCVGLYGEIFEYRVVKVTAKRIVLDTTRHGLQTYLNRETEHAGHFQQSPGNWSLYFADRARAEKHVAKLGTASRESIELAYPGFSARYLT